MFVTFAYCDFNICLCKFNRIQLVVKDDCLNCTAQKCSIKTCNLQLSTVSKLAFPPAIGCKIESSDLINEIHYHNVCSMTQPQAYACFGYDKSGVIMRTPCLTNNYDFVLPCNVNEVKDGLVLTCSLSEKIKTLMNREEKLYVEKVEKYDGLLLGDDFQSKFLDYIKLNKNNDMSNEEIFSLAKYSKDAYDIPNQMELIDIDFAEDKDLNLLAIVGYSRNLRALVVVFRGTHFENINNSKAVQSSKPPDGIEKNIDSKFKQISTMTTAEKLNNKTLINDWIIQSVSKIATDQITIKEKIDICKDCEVHSGLYQSFIRIKGIIQKITRIREVYPFGVIFTGHGYGAALATLGIAMFNKTNNKIQTSLVTFGSPRVGNEKFATFINTSTFGKNIRVIYGQDPFICTPFTSKTADTYFHVGKEIHYVNSSTPSEPVAPNAAAKATCQFNPNFTSDHIGYWNFFIVKAKRLRDLNTSKRFLK